MNSVRGLKRVIVVFAVIAFAIAAVCDVVLAFTLSRNELGSAVIPALIMAGGIYQAVKHYEVDEQIDQRYRRHPLLTFLGDGWGVVVFSFAAAMHPIYGLQVWELKPIQYVLLTAAIWLIPVGLVRAGAAVTRWVLQGFAKS